MDGHETFTETAVREAAARRTRVDLVLDPVTPDTDSRLISRLLGINTDGHLVLDVPKTRQGKKVFVPTGWRLGLAFELADLWMQSRSVVLGHCHFPVLPGRRVDALTVERPEKIISCNERKRPRQSADPLHPASATILATHGRDDERPLSPCHFARLRNWSEEGMGLQIDGPHSLEAGFEVLIHVQVSKLAKGTLFRGTVMHVTMLAPDVSLIGVGDVQEVPEADVASRPEAAWPE